MSAVAADLSNAVADVDFVMNDPSPEVVVAGLDGSHQCVDVLFWHEPDLATERMARDAAGRALLSALDRLEVTLADPIVQVTTPTTAPPSEAPE